MNRKLFLLTLCFLIASVSLIFAGQISFVPAKPILEKQLAHISQSKSIPFIATRGETLKYDTDNFDRSVGIQGSGTPGPDQTYGFATYFVLSEFGITDPRQVGSILLYFGSGTVTDFRLYIWDGAGGVPNSHGTHLYVDMNAPLPQPNAWTEYDLSANNIVLPDTFWVGICYNEIITPPSWYVCYESVTPDVHTYGNLSGASGAWTAMGAMGDFGYAYGVRAVVEIPPGIAEEPGKTATLVFGLSQNAPNPVRDGQTTISYTTTRKGPVSLKVYDIAGRLVRTLIDRNESAGHKTVYWDGKDDNHRSVAAGVFFYRLVAEENTATKKMVLVR